MWLEAEVMQNNGVLLFSGSRSTRDPRFHSGEIILSLFYIDLGTLDIVQRFTYFFRIWSFFSRL
jgi:hypothetical protein